MGKVLVCDPCILMYFAPSDPGGPHPFPPQLCQRGVIREVSPLIPLLHLAVTTPAKLCLITTVTLLCEINLLIHLGLN